MDQPHRWMHPLHGLRPDPELTPSEAALLVIDMQYLDAHPDYGMVAALNARGQQDVYDYYTARLRTIVPNIQRLQAAFRGARMEVLYAVIEALTQDGRDRGAGHKRSGLFARPGSKEGQVLEELAPGPDEMVFKKTCGSVFTGTNIDFVLRNLGIRTLVLCGVVTSGCVEVAARDANDLGYDVVVVEDATATWTQDLQDAATYILGVYANVTTTDRLVARFGAARAAAR